MFGITQDTVRRVINDFAQMGDFVKDFTPPIYNIWNLAKQDNATDSHFGSFPLYFMKSLLYYHTKPMDIIFDPFAGGGTTVDACKAMMRRYYCSDMIVKPGREKDILEHDITKGLPDGMPKPDMVFLDPPYWKQAECKYSDEPTDLANMSLNEFYNAINNLMMAVVNRHVENIALVISPTQYPNDLIFEDHIFTIDKMIYDKYRIDMRYVIPYSTQQYNGTQVDKAKAENICLSLHRDLIVWRIK
jgi:hypothetical protein